MSLIQALFYKKASKVTTKFQLTAIGNAIVDILANTDEEFLTAQAAHGMNRAAMTLIDENRARALYPLINRPMSADHMVRVIVAGD